jgi:DNA-binding CsgD family transcriptional regulator
MSLAHLSSADLRKVVEAGYQILEAEDPEQLAFQVQEVLHTMVGADIVVWNELTAEGKVSTGMTFPELPNDFWTNVAPGMLAHIHEHPFVKTLAEQPSLSLTAAISDLLPTSRFIQTGLYAVGYREFAAKYQISSAWGTADGGHLVVSLNRRSSDFSSRDKAVLDAVARQAARTYQSLRQIEGLRFRLQRTERGQSVPSTTWLYVDAHLIVKWGAPELEDFLRHHFHHQRLNLFLPAALASVIAPLLSDESGPSSGGAKRPASGHLAYCDRHYDVALTKERMDHYRLTITEAPPPQAQGAAGGRHQPLSRREAEAAHWAALGKTNPEIGIILGISARTVEKHVHAALAKLGFENRVQMARWAAENT